MQTKIAKQITYWLGVAAVGLVVGLSVQFVRAWTEPTVAPPGGNVGAPINTSGFGQTKVGALILNCGTGVNCVFNGSSAANGLLVPNGNVGIGTTSPNNTIQVANLINFDDSVYGTFLGYQAGNANTGNNNSFIGYQAGLNNTTGSSNSAMGRDALLYNTTGIFNSAMGRSALLSNTTGGNNSAMGGSALYSNTIGNNNTANGNAALLSNTAGNGNSAIGKDALRLNTTGNYNSAMGFNALYFNTTGDSNVAMGRALYSNTAGVGNSAIGINALESNTTGNYNSAMGNSALYSNTTGNYNAAMGHSALYSNTIGVNNSAMGENAGKSITTGNFNTFLGYAAGFDASQKVNAVNSMALGYGANTTADNQIVIGNSSVTQTLLKGKVGIRTTSPQGVLDVVSTTGAFIVPRMTTVQRDALTAVNGMIVYNTTGNQFNFYENGAWVLK